MKQITAFLCVLMLLGCGSKPATVSVAETAKESLSALSKTLPAECQTDGVMAQIAVVERLVETQLKVCETEKDVLKAEKARSDILLSLLAIFILVYTGLRLAKKL